MRVDGKPSGVDVQNFVAALRTGTPLNTATLAPAADVVLPERNSDVTVDLRLAGPLSGYTWPINGKLYDPPNDGSPLTPAACGCGCG
ncbi:MAG: multicopper oxidase [Mycobacterium sp.]|jgi:hypothetical protein|nr:multicopper oxidase [Mycobacterium sp.]